MNFVVGNHGGRFDFHQRALFHQAANFYDRHGWKILAHDFAVSRADFTNLAKIGLSAQDEPGQANYVGRIGLRTLTMLRKVCPT
jgi:hypothetical protein